MVTKKIDWTNFKQKISTKGLSIQGEEYSDHYNIWALENLSVMYLCSFMKDSSDAIEFEASYKSNWNQKIVPIDSDGSPIQRIKVTSSGWSLNYHCIEITTSSLNAVVNKNSDNSDFNFSTVRLYDNQDELITLAENQGNCVKTVIDWEPTFDYDIIGGDVLQVASPGSDIRVSVIGVPDIPAEYGGNKAFMTGFNLKYLGTNKLTIDGKTPKSLVYNAQNHTNKLRFIFYHNAGVSHTIHIILNIFKA